MTKTSPTAASRTAPRVRIPETAKSGEIIEVKTLITHEMESGQRRTKDGAVVPRHIIKEFRATFDGVEIMRADWFPAMAANPFQSFHVKVTRSGVFTFTWVDDDGSLYTSNHTITVS